MNSPETNVDPAELAKFADLSHRWWDAEGAMRPLHELNPVRVDFVRTRAPLGSARLLDVGCGGGILSESLARLGAKVTGIDAGDETLTVARLHRIESGLEIDYRLCTAEEMAASEEQRFDVVTCMELLEHVPDPAAVVAACAQLVRPGGHVFFATLNRTPKAYALAVLTAEYLLGMLPRGTHDYDRFVRPSELDAWARPHDLSLTELRGVSYQPLARRYSLSDDVSVNYLACYQAAEENPGDSV